MSAIIKFGGWYDGDNFKPGRAWYYVCDECREIGLGQLLPQSAQRAYEKHARCCKGRVSFAQYSIERIKGK